MAAKSRRTPASLVERLTARPEDFEFFQALRLLEQVALSQSEDASAIEFSGNSNLSFPGNSVSKIAPAEEDGRKTWRAEVKLFGLTGTAGVLPYHYSELVQQRLRLRDRGLKSFLDLFNSRLIHLFYKAWRKYRLPFAYEYHKLAGKNGEDSFTRTISSLAGLGTPSLKNDLPINNDSLLGLSGILSRPVRPAIAVEQALQYYFGLPIAIKQFRGQWLDIPEDTQSKLPGGELPLGMNCELGRNAILGSHGWQIQSKFSVLIKNITYQQLMDLQPGGQKLRQLKELTRLLTRDEFDFDIVITTDAVSIPELRLDNDNSKPPLLGWNTALGEARHVDNIRIVVT
jgi:type VI secretion system protein ImpH